MSLGMRDYPKAADQDKMKLHAPMSPRQKEYTITVSKFKTPKTMVCSGIV